MLTWGVGLAVVLSEVLTSILWLGHRHVQLSTLLASGRNTSRIVLRIIADCTNFPLYYLEKKSYLIDPKGVFVFLLVKIYWNNWQLLIQSSCSEFSILHWNFSWQKRKCLDLISSTHKHTLNKTDIYTYINMNIYIYVYIYIVYILTYNYMYI